MGVARRGLEIGESVGLGLEELRTFVAACLLHDIGHYPSPTRPSPGSRAPWAWPTTA